VSAATVVLVHGGGGSPTDWDRVVPLLADRDVPSVLVDLPSCRAEAARSDAAELRSVLEDQRGSVVLVGHSYGVDMPGDHFPHWRRPDEVADIIARVAAG
jgi:pimeloyl-ACP methyl ester carboxylesterase